jgi:hypothetical protein
MGENQSAYVVLGGFVAALLLLIFFVGAGGGKIDASPIGTDGLHSWLEGNGVSATKSHRRTPLAEDDVALRILPLYDTDIERDAPPVDDREDRRAQSTQRDIYSEVYIEKVSYVPSLVMLPKWRSGVLELDLLDPQLLIQHYAYIRLLSQIQVPQLQITRPDIKFLQTTSGITLYRPQLFLPKSVRGDCRPHLTLPQGVLIARCDQRSGVPYFILSDPDLLNNHGLSLNGNADAAIDVISDMVGSHEGTVYLDTAPDILLAQDPTVQREVRPRTIEDVSRFLTYPFSLILIGAGISFLILLWRGLIRFGPPRQTNEGHISASKTASITAKGYLLRLAGDDRAVLQDYVAEKMKTLGNDTMGKQAQMDQPKLIARLRNIAPRTTPQLEGALGTIQQIDTDTSSADLARLAEKFEDIYRRLRDELGYVSRRR